MARLAIACLAAFLVCSSDALGATTISLRFHGPRGERVQVTRAQILLAGWGWVDQKDIAANADTIRVTLDPTLKTSKGNELGHAETAFFYVEARGFASWRSDAFRWPLAESFEPMHIVVGSGRELIVRPGDDATADIALIRSGNHRITLIDEAGKPVVRVPVEVFMFWSNQNHCGRFDGVRSLTGDETNARGTIEAPALDGEYGLRLQGEHMAFVDHESEPSEAVVRPSGAETIVRIHRHQRARLRVKIIDRERPVDNAVLMVDKQLGTCGAGDGQLSKSGADGVIAEPDFYPEEWQQVAVCYANTTLWQGDPAELPETLDIGTLSGMPSYLCER